MVSYMLHYYGPELVTKCSGASCRGQEGDRGLVTGVWDCNVRTWVLGILKREQYRNMTIVQGYPEEMML